MKMLYCKKCLQPNTRPGILFSDDQVCYACLYEEEKKKIDWEKRFEDLVAIAQEAKEKARKANCMWDCAIGVSGGKDSTFQALYAKEKLGLRVLLVNCRPDKITEIGQHNLDNLVDKGFDMIQLRPNPVVAKKLARKTFFERGNIVAASEYCLYASVFVVADRFHIPLIIHGENDALTLGTALKQEQTDDAFSVASLDTVRGFDIDELIEGVEGVTRNDMRFYQIPDADHMKQKGIKAVFLQYYAKEWSQVYNADFAVSRGLWGRQREDLHDIGRYRLFTALDSDLQIANQMIKYLKFGFGFATDEACYDIREGRLSREEAIWLVNEYDGGCGEKYIRIACAYLDISETEFWEVVDSYVNKDLFEKVDGKWLAKFKVGEDFVS